MADYIGRLVYEITGDTKALETSLNTARSKTTSFAGHMKGIASSVAGFIAQAFAVGTIVNFFKKSSEAASNAAEVASKYNVVFSEIPQLANDVAKSFAEAYGMAQSASQKLLSDTGNLLEGMGMTQKGALYLSESINSLAADLVSFTNYSGGVEGASRALTSALMGETEAAKSLGLALGDEQLAAFASKQGLNINAMGMQEKGLLRIKLAAEQAKNSIGDYAATSDSFANTMRKVDERLEGIKVSAGNEVNPALLMLSKSFLIATGSGGLLTDMLDSASKAAGTLIKGYAYLSMAVQQYAAKAKQVHNKALASMEAEDAKKAAAALKSYMDEHRKGNETYAETYKRLSAAHDSEFIKLEKEKNTARDSALSHINNAMEASDQVLKVAEAYEQMTSQSKKATDETEIRAKKQKELNDLILSAQNEMKKGGKTPTGNGKAQAKELEIQVDHWNDIADAANQALVSIGRGPVYTHRISDEVDGLVSESDRLLAKIQEIDAAMQTWGSAGLDVLSGLSAATAAYYDAQLAGLDAQMQAELEAAGVAEESAVEKAQKELDAAVKSGDKTAIEEKKKALKKAKIEEEYDKKRSALEFKAAMREWQYQEAIAITNVPLAISKALASAPPPYNFILAALSGAAAGLQLAAVSQSKPKKSNYAEGGVVPGSMYAGDHIQANVNSGEMILNAQQQRELWQAANGGTSGGGTTHIHLHVGDKEVQEVVLAGLYDATANGQAMVHPNGIAAR